MKHRSLLVLTFVLAGLLLGAMSTRAVQAQMTRFVKEAGRMQAISKDSQLPPRFFTSFQQTTPEATLSVLSTPVPPAFPPPTNPRTTGLIILSGMLIVLVILLGIVLNRKRIF